MPNRVIYPDGITLCVFREIIIKNKGVSLIIQIVTGTQSVCYVLKNTNNNNLITGLS